MALSPASYDPQPRLLRTVPGFYNARENSVLVIRWQDGIRKDAVIAAGDLLATVVWDDGLEDGILAPSGCQGIVLRTNRQIRYETLHRQAQDLLELSQP